MLFVALKNSGLVFMVTWLSTILVGRVFDFHFAYVQFMDQKNKEEWLRTQCESDEFYHRMAYHSDLCEQVANNAKISPVLYSLNESMGQMKLCGFYTCEALFKLVLQGGTPVIICMVLLYLLTPSFIIPIIQNGYSNYCVQQFNRRCSPYRRDNDAKSFSYPASDSISHTKYV